MLEILLICLAIFIGIFLIGLKAKHDMKRDEAKAATYRKEHEDELFYKECRKAGILTDNAVGIARMKLVASKMGISCNDSELVEKYNKGRLIEKSQMNADAERKNKNELLLS